MPSIVNAYMSPHFLCCFTHEAVCMSIWLNKWIHVTTNDVWVFIQFWNLVYIQVALGVPYILWKFKSDDIHSCGGVASQNVVDFGKCQMTESPPPPGGIWQAMLEQTTLPSLPPSGGIWWTMLDWLWLTVFLLSVFFPTEGILLPTDGILLPTEGIHVKWGETAKQRQRM